MAKSYVVRQPIFDEKHQVVAYELLFHRASSGDLSDREMTSHVIANGIDDIGLEKLTGNKPAYINFSRELLLDGTALLLSPDHVGIEILETVEIDEELLVAIRHLKALGYRIALDDFEYEDKKRELIELADQVKLDVLTSKDLPSTVRALSQFPAKLLAEKVETYQEYDQMKKLGFKLFQGYYFCRPQTVEGNRLPGSKLAVLRALKEISTADSMEGLNDIIGHDINMSYKLLRYINSAAFGFRRQIESIEQAVSLLGLNNIRRWLTVLSLSMLGDDKPPELVRQAMLRGKIMEDISGLLGLGRRSDYFVLGMFSLIEALLDQPMRVAVKEIVLPKVVQQGLFEPKSTQAMMLALVSDVERADWHAMNIGCRAMGLDLDAVLETQEDAAKWLEEYSSASPN